MTSYLLSWLAAALSGLGVAAYHPEAARMARAVSGGSHVGMSWFSLGGNVGSRSHRCWSRRLATGGLSLTPLLVVPALVGAVIRRWPFAAARLVAAATCTGRRGTTGRRSCGCRRS